MALFLLSYDLRKQRHYQALYDELAKFKAVRILESDWCFTHPTATTAALRDHFRQFIDGDDGLLVCEVTNWATVKTRGTPNDLK